MIKKFIYSKTTQKEIDAYIDKINNIELKVTPKIISIINKVKNQGDAALLEYAKVYDKANLKSLKVPAEAIKKAYKSVDKTVLLAMKKAIENIKAFHKMQKANINGYVYQNKGYKITQKYIPVDIAGLYIPGGQAPLFSTVFMAGLPAKIAGVKRVVLLSPPRHNGEVAPHILAAADMIGITEIYRVGGAQAIAALAFGTQTIPKADKVAGPGNIYSTMAKKYLFGTVGVDALNGPSEVTLIADETANPKYIIYDLLAQAEHINGHALLLTTSQTLATAVEKGIKAAAGNMKIQVTIVIVKDLNTAVKIANKKAPEHLVIITEAAETVAAAITNAGAIFTGNYSPVAFGDYMAGANHILPTNGTARFFSGLSVLDFLKHTHIVEGTKIGIEAFGPDTEVLANAEGMKFHAESVRVRRKK